MAGRTEVAQPKLSGPKRNLVLGHLPAFAADMLGFLRRCADEHGDIVPLRFGLARAVLFNHPDQIEEVLLTRHQDFVRYRFFWRHVTKIFGNGLLTSTGETWRLQHALMAPAFRADRLAASAEDIVACAEQLSERWQDGAECDVRDQMTRLTLRIAARVLFGLDLDDDADGITRAVDRGIAEVSDRFKRGLFLPDWLPTAGNRRYMAAVRDFDDAAAAILAKRQTPFQPGSDLLSALLQSRDGRGQPIDRRLLRDQIVTLLLAGHETTALALTWTLYLLSRHPEAAARVEDEVDAVLGHELRPGAGHLDRLRYLSCSVNEAMRLYPPVFLIGRENVRDVEIGRRLLPAGTICLLSQWVVHRDPRFWRDPNSFKPERWEAGTDPARPRYAYFPFGGGPRICIGRSFAMIEAVLVLATLFRRFRLVASWPAPPVEPCPSITLRPAGAVRLVVSRRRS
ncbi:MAG: cytochrome P450 [Rhodospirillales bacterium]|nr:cytochrome P450 [Rhodospirillales bacterium]